MNLVQLFAVPKKSLLFQGSSKVLPRTTGVWKRSNTCCFLMCRMLHCFYYQNIWNRIYFCFLKSEQQLCSQLPKNKSSEIMRGTGWAGQQVRETTPKLEVLSLPWCVKVELNVTGQSQYRWREFIKIMRKVVDKLLWLQREQWEEACQLENNSSRLHWPLST